jgi:hypothetical protein
MLAVASCGVRAGNVVLLPMGFEGWVAIRYDVPAGTALEREWAKTLIRVPRSGVVSCRSRRSSGYGIDEYYFVTTDGLRRRVPTDAHGCSEQEACVQLFQFFFSPTTTTLFFVGKRANVPLYRRPEP